jgi:hypothetical protein
MAKNKTTETNANVEEFIASFAETEQKRKDAFTLLKMMGDATGFEPKMWGPSMIGFGQYHYKSERSTQEGDWFLVGFSPRKAAISLYVYSGCAGQDELLNNLGKFKMGKSCIYVNKLSDIDLDILKKLIHSTIDFLVSRN